MSESWNEILTNEAVDLTPRPGFEAQLRAGLSDEWDGRPMITRNVDSPTRRTPKRAWLFGAVAVALLVLGGVIVANRPNGDPVVQTPVPQPIPANSTSDAASTTLPVVPPVSQPVGESTLPATTLPSTTMTATTQAPAVAEVIVVPLEPTNPIVVEPVATVAYGLGDDQIQVVNGQFPPPAVWHAGGVLVLEDAVQSGLTGDGVIVETGDDADFGAGERRIQPVSINVAEPGGVPIGVRSLDGGGVIIATVHDDDPAVRIRSYTQNPSTEFNLFGEGRDFDGLGGSLDVTAEGATWGGDPVTSPDSAVARPEVSSEPASGFSPEYAVFRPSPDGGAGLSWQLTVESDAEFPPGPGGPVVEPFGDGVLFAVRGSSAREAQFTVVLLDANGTGSAYDVDGWTLNDVRPEGAVVTRSTQAGLEIGILRPTAASESPAVLLPQGLADWPAPSEEPGDLADVVRLLPGANIEGVTQVLRRETVTAVEIYDYVQTWLVDDGTGYVEITTNIDQFGGTPPEFQTPVDIDGWEEAYFARSTPEFANLRLVSEAGVVAVNQRGLGRDRVVEIARSIQRRPLGEPGWEIDDAGLTPFNEFGDAGNAFRSLRFNADDVLVAELTVGVRPLNGAPINWFLSAEIERFEIDGLPAVAADNGFATAISWSLADGTGVLFGYRGRIDEAVDLARSLMSVDQATWETQTRVNDSTDDGCDGLFC